MCLQQQQLLLQGGGQESCLPLSLSPLCIMLVAARSSHSQSRVGMFRAHSSLMARCWKKGVGVCLLSSHNPPPPLCQRHLWQLQEEGVAAGGAGVNGGPPHLAFWELPSLLALPLLPLSPPFQRLLM